MEHFTYTKTVLVCGRLCWELFYVWIQQCWICDKPVYWKLLQRGQYIIATLSNSTKSSKNWLRRASIRVLAITEELRWKRINQPPFDLFWSIEHYLRGRRFTEDGPSGTEYSAQNPPNSTPTESAKWMEHEECITTISMRIQIQHWPRGPPK